MLLDSVFVTPKGTALFFEISNLTLSYHSCFFNLFFFIWVLVFFCCSVKLNENQSNRALYEGTQLGGCIAVMSICDERGGGRGKRARKAGAVEAIRFACEYFHQQCPRTDEHFTAAKSTLKRMDKKCSIV